MHGARNHTSALLPYALCIVPLLFACNVSAQNEGQTPAAQSQDLHWGIKLGLRSLQVTQAFPLVDRVVLVPDAATYLDELGKWSPRGRWPVLFDEPQFASMFVRRFKPAEVIRRESVGELPADKSDHEKLLESIVISSWGGDPELHTLEETFQRHSFTPPGVVMTSVEDPAWTAAVALAAGHGQPMVFIDGRFGEDSGVANENIVRRLEARFEEAVAALPHARRELGDDIDAVTVCRALAPRTRMMPAGAAEPDGFAFTDLIGRNTDNTRWAFTGWIFGGAERSAYVAMCSLFLERTDALLINTYTEDGQWGSYGLANVNEALRQIGFTPTLHGSTWANLDNWLRLLPGGIRSDFVFVNTRGMREHFELASGRAFALDVPTLNTPVAVHFIHSFSMNDPADRTTVAGRWIDHGAYAFVGSVVEPTLAGFVPPLLVTERIVNYVPFLVASRHWDPPWSNPGKIATFGDPLMLIIPPDKAKKARITQPREDGTNLLQRVRELMTQIKESPSAALYSEVVELLVLLGKDDIAADMWVHARQNGFAEAAADRALGALFRQQRRDEFMQAWMAMGTRTDADVDMLWHLWTPMLDNADKDALLQLQSAIRRGQPEVDVGRLLPHLDARFGQAHAVRVVEREIDKTTDDGTRKRLRELIGRDSRSRPRTNSR
jgi:hypothetical protein